MLGPQHQEGVKAANLWEGFGPGSQIWPVAREAGDRAVLGQAFALGRSPAHPATNALLSGRTLAMASRPKERQGINYNHKGGDSWQWMPWPEVMAPKH